MTDRRELRERIERQIESNRWFTEAAEAILAEIETTHVLVPRSLAERAAEKLGTGGNAAWERSTIASELARYANPKEATPDV
jgi:hypothetical protein